MHSGLRKALVCAVALAFCAGASFAQSIHAWAYDSSKPVNGGKSITLQVWDADEKYDRFFKQYGAQYSKYHPNVTFQFTFTPWDEYWKKLPLAIAGGEGPDVFHFHNAYTVQFIDGNLIAPYPDEWIPALKQDFLQIPQHIVNGKLYYFDNGLMTSYLYYNTKILKDAGVSEQNLPKTWDQLTAIAKKLVKKDAGGKMTQEGLSINGNQEFVWEAMVYQGGDYLFSADGKSVSSGDAAKKALQKIVNWYGPDGISSIDFPIANESFGTGKAAFAYSWGWWGTFLKDTYPSLGWGVVPVPTWTGSMSPAADRNNGDATPGVNPRISAERKAVAFDFVHFLCDNEKASVDAAVMTAQAPVMRRIMASPEVKANRLVSLAASLIDRTVWPGPFPPSYDDIWSKTIGDGLKVGQSVDTMLKAYVDQENANLAEQNEFWWTYERSYAHAGDMRPSN